MIRCSFEIGFNLFFKLWAISLKLNPFSSILWIVPLTILCQIPNMSAILRFEIPPFNLS